VISSNEQSYNKNRDRVVNYLLLQHRPHFLLFILGLIVYGVFVALLRFYSIVSWSLLVTAILAFALIILAFTLYFYYDFRFYLLILNKLENYQKTDNNESSENILSNLIEEYSLVYAKEELSKEYNEQIYNKQMEIEVLQSRINPHFLYNTLDSIRGEALLQGAHEIAYMTEALASLFRYGVNIKGNFVTLADEVENVDNYMKLQKFRFENRFIYKLEMDDEEVLKCVVPKLTLQPLVENAITHGLESINANGCITIRVLKTDSTLIINVLDNGIGIETKKLAEIQASMHEGLQSRYAEYAKGKNTGIALNNINDRIKISFGTQYGLDIYSVLSAGTNVEVTLPIIYKMPQQ